MKNKIVLFTINSKTRLYGITEKNYSSVQPNIIMALQQSYLKDKGIEVDMIDETYDFSISDYINYLHKEKPLLAGIICIGANPSSSTMSMVGAIKFFEEYNKNKVKGTKMFILGGHPSVTPKRTLKETNVDYVIIGEGYKTLRTLYTAIKEKKNTNFVGIYSKKYPNTLFPQLININKLPMVDWNEMNPNKYRAHNWHAFCDIENRSPYGVVWSSFGCPYNCNFCSVCNIFGKRVYRVRDMKSVVDEIGVLVSKGVHHIKIMDELFVTKGKRIAEFCDLLEERNYNINMWAYGRVDTVTPEILKRLKKVGVNWISYGFETSTQEVLNDLDKGYNQNYDEVIKWTKDAGMNICADFIAGLWEDNYDTLQATYNFACKHNFEWLNLYPCFAYPGTPLYDEYLEKGRMEVPKNWEEYALYGYNCVPLKTKYLTSAEILKWRDNAFIRYCDRGLYQEKIALKFGIKTLNHILEMIRHPLRRRIYE